MDEGKIIEEIKEDIKEIKDDFKEIKKILDGNGKLGVAAKANLSYEYIQMHIKERSGTWTWLFRAFLTILIGYIAWKVGLVH